MSTHSEVQPYTPPLKAPEALTARVYNFLPHDKGIEIGNVLQKGIANGHSWDGIDTIPADFSLGTTTLAGQPILTITYDGKAYYWVQEAPEYLQLRGIQTFGKTEPFTAKFDYLVPTAFTIYPLLHLKMNDFPGQRPEMITWLKENFMPFNRHRFLQDSGIWTKKEGTVFHGVRNNHMINSLGRYVAEGQPPVPAPATDTNSPTNNPTTNTATAATTDEAVLQALAKDPQACVDYLNYTRYLARAESNNQEVQPAPRANHSTCYTNNFHQGSIQGSIIQGLFPTENSTQGTGTGSIAGNLEHNSSLPTAVANPIATEMAMGMLQRLLLSNNNNDTANTIPTATLNPTALDILQRLLLSNNNYKKNDDAADTIPTTAMVNNPTTAATTNNNAANSSATASPPVNPTNNNDTVNPGTALDDGDSGDVQGFDDDDEEVPYGVFGISAEGPSDNNSSSSTTRVTPSPSAGSATQPTGTFVPIRHAETSYTFDPSSTASKTVTKSTTASKNLHPDTETFFETFRYEPKMASGKPMPSFGSPKNIPVPTSTAAEAVSATSTLAYQTTTTFGKKRRVSTGNTIAAVKQMGNNKMENMPTNWQPAAVWKASNTLGEKSISTLATEMDRVELKETALFAEAEFPPSQGWSGRVDCTIELVVYCHSVYKDKDGNQDKDGNGILSGVDQNGKWHRIPGVVPQDEVKPRGNTYHGGMSITTRYEGKMTTFQLGDDLMAYALQKFNVEQKDVQALQLDQDGSLRYILDDGTLEDFDESVPDIDFKNHPCQLTELAQDYPALDVVKYDDDGLNVHNFLIRVHGSTTSNTLGKPVCSIDPNAAVKTAPAVATTAPTQPMKNSLAITLVLFYIDSEDESLLGFDVDGIPYGFEKGTVSEQDLGKRTFEFVYNGEPRTFVLQTNLSDVLVPEDMGLDGFSIAIRRRNSSDPNSGPSFYKFREGKLEPTDDIDTKNFASLKLSKHPENWTYPFATAKTGHFGDVVVVIDLTTKL